MLKMKSHTEGVWVPESLLRGELSGDQEYVLDMNEFGLLTRHVSDAPSLLRHTAAPHSVGINMVL